MWIWGKRTWKESWFKFLRGPARGGPRSLVGILKYLVSAFLSRVHVAIGNWATCILGFEVDVGIIFSKWNGRRLSLFHLGAVATFWPMSLVQIYPGRASFKVTASEPLCNDILHTLIVSYRSFLNCSFLQTTKLICSVVHVYMNNFPHFTVHKKIAK